MQLRNDYYECLLVIAQVSADQNVPFFFLKKKWIYRPSSNTTRGQLSYGTLCDQADGDVMLCGSSSLGVLETSCRLRHL